MCCKTLEQIEQLPKEMLTALDVCAYLETDPSIIRWQAQNEPDKLGFPVIVMKSRVKIPKQVFLHYCRFGRAVADLNHNVTGRTEEPMPIKDMATVEELITHFSDELLVEICENSHIHQAAIGKLRKKMYLKDEQSEDTQAATLTQIFNRILSGE